MTTISVPLSDDMLKSLEMLIKLGIAPNKAEALRQALRLYMEDQAVEAVLRARGEPSLSGEIDSLAKQII